MSNAEMVIMYLAKLTRAVARSDWDSAVTYSESISEWARKALGSEPTVDRHVRLARAQIRDLAEERRAHLQLVKGRKN